LDGKLWTPTECSAEVLKTLKSEAEAYWLVEVKDVVITFPAWFTPQQRDLTREAAIRAGLNVIGMIEEPVAAALAHLIGQKLNRATEEGQSVHNVADILCRTLGGMSGEPRGLLVYHLGGGTFDVALVQLWGELRDDGNAVLHTKVLCNDGDVWLGGKNWDEALKGMVVERDIRDNGHDPMDDPAAGSMDDRCELAKRDLGITSPVTILCPKLHRITVTRQELENATSTLVERTRYVVEYVIAKAETDYGIKKEALSLVAAGGMCKWPAVTEMLTRVMDGCGPGVPRDVDLEVSIGAAYLAHLTAEPEPQTKVMPMSVDQVACVLRGEDDSPASLLRSAAADSLGRMKRDLAEGRYWDALAGRTTETRVQALPQGGNFEMPGGIVDHVHFTVTSPPVVQPSTSFLIGIWAHLEKQRKAVIERAQRASLKQDICLSSQGPVDVSRGAVMSARLRLDGFAVEPAEVTILWRGEIGSANFGVTVPPKVKRGRRLGTATVHINGLQVAMIYFTLDVGVQSEAPIGIDAKVRRHRTAFASYASPDRDSVLLILQGLQKGLPSMEIFLDVEALRSGQKWQQELQRVIPSRDVFYLFWSGHAKDSRWVRMEWRCAFEKRGRDFIDPFPLVSPEDVPPPKELKDLHFYERWLAYRRK
jgi:hypothetical protein